MTEDFSTPRHYSVPKRMKYRTRTNPEDLSVNTLIGVALYKNGAWRCKVNSWVISGNDWMTNAPTVPYESLPDNIRTRISIVDAANVWDFNDPVGYVYYRANDVVGMDLWVSERDLGSLRQMKGDELRVYARGESEDQGKENSK